MRASDGNENKVNIQMNYWDLHSTRHCLMELEYWDCVHACGCADDNVQREERVVTEMLAHHSCRHWHCCRSSVVLCWYHVNIERLIRVINQDQVRNLIRQDDEKDSSSCTRATSSYLAWLMICVTLTARIYLNDVPLGKMRIVQGYQNNIWCLLFQCCQID